MTRYYIEVRHANNDRTFETRFGYAKKDERDSDAKRFEANGCPVELSERNL